MSPAGIGFGCAGGRQGLIVVMSKINWKLIAFIGVLWWLIYSAPTEDSLFTMFVHKAGGTSASDDF